MTENEKQMAAALGLTEKDFQPKPRPEDRLAELEAQNQMLTQCLMEMSQIVYA